jgi:hypothetical protein
MVPPTAFFPVRVGDHVRLGGCGLVIDNTDETSVRSVSVRVSVCRGTWARASLVMVTVSG